MFRLSYVLPVAGNWLRGFGLAQKVSGGRVAQTLSRTNMKELVEKCLKADGNQSAQNPGHPQSAQNPGNPQSAQNPGNWLRGLGLAKKVSRGRLAQTPSRTNMKGMVQKCLMADGNQSAQNPGNLQSALNPGNPHVGASSLLPKAFLQSNQYVYPNNRNLYMDAGSFRHFSERFGPQMKAPFAPWKSSKQ